MKILVDADACPVNDIIINIAKDLNIELIFVLDNTHKGIFSYGDVFLVDKGRDSADFVIINKTNKKDIVVTNDYGLAAMALSKQAYCINFYGMEYTDKNIESLLYRRHLGKETRRLHGKTKGPKKRKKSDDENFYNSFYNLVEKIIDKFNL